jgi:hypothetical protein
MGSTCRFRFVSDSFAAAVDVRSVVGWTMKDATAGRRRISRIAWR